MGRRKSKETQTRLHTDPLEVLRMNTSWSLRRKTFSDVMCSVSFSSTCKMWKTASKRCSQSGNFPSWLVHPHPHQTKSNRDIISGEWEYYWWWLHRYPCKGRLCCPQGVQFCKEKSIDWIKEVCDLEDPNSFHPLRKIQFTNSIRFNEKIYVLSLQGTLASIDMDSYPRISILNIERAIPSTSFKGFREYLVEISGNLLVIFLVSKKSMDIVDNIEVYKLDLAILKWTKMASLGDHALFMRTESCQRICPPPKRCGRYSFESIDDDESDSWWTKLGYRRNRIYFTQGKTNDWWKFNMEDRTISSPVHTTLGPSIL